MKAMTVKDGTLTLTDVEKPAPQRGEVLIRVCALVRLTAQPPCF